VGRSELWHVSFSRLLGRNLFQVALRVNHDDADVLQLSSAAIVESRNCVVDCNDSKVTLTSFLDRGPRTVWEIGAGKHQSRDAEATKV
jgi:hypothetical protein